MVKTQKPAVNPIVARIDAEIAARGGSRQKVSLDAGLDRGFLQKLNERGPSASTFVDNLKALARAARIPFEDLMAVAPSGSPIGEASRLPLIDEPISSARTQIPIMGLVAGSALGNYAISPTPLGYVRSPPALERVPGAYAVYVQNDSMEPMHAQGDLRFVHPYLPARKDDSVVVQVRDGRGEIEAYIKLYVKITAEWLTCRQINPAAEIKYKREHVIHVHRVLTINELFFT